jgi:hypothetical protein
VTVVACGYTFFAYVIRAISASQEARITFNWNHFSLANFANETFNSKTNLVWADTFVEPEWVPVVAGHTVIYQSLTVAVLGNILVFSLWILLVC